MEEPGLTPTPEAKPTRPSILTVLCILTFIGSGMNAFSSLFISGFYDAVVEVVKVFAEKFNIPGMEEMTAAGPAYFFVSGLFYLGSLTGAWMMFRLRKTGFHVYTVFQILLILAPMYFLHLPSPGFVEIFFSGLFVLLYSRHLKIMA